MKEYYIRIMTELSCSSIDAILNKVDDCLLNKYDRIHLLISTPGGAVNRGISLANYLKGIPMEIYTYNFGVVDSVGIAVYSVGAKRFCTPQARFLMHPVNMLFIGSQNIDKEFLLRKLNEIEIDTRNVAGIISNGSNMNIDEVICCMEKETIFDAYAALKCGLVNEVSSLNILRDIELFSIFSDS